MNNIVVTSFNMIYVRTNSSPRNSHRLEIICKFLIIALTILSSTRCNQYTQARFVDSSTFKPSIILISPQSFNVPTGASQSGDDGPQNRVQQYVAVINNIQDEREDQLLRQQYKKLSLQVRDASSPATGQLFYEHVFDYFAPNPKGQHLLLPINLDQVSTITNEQSSSAARSYSGVVSGKEREPKRTSQFLIVSIRPYHLESGFGSESIEFVSSSPVPVVPVPTSDGLRSFAIVQTDKPIYKPDEKVRIRSLIINENLKAVTRDEFKLQVKNPDKIIVEELRFPSSTTDLSRTTGKKDEPLFFDHVFEFPPEPMLGFWSVHLLHSDPIANDTISFEVKEYELPTYGIEFQSPKYILPSTEVISGSIVAKYHYGKGVQGKAHFKFAYQETLTSRPRFLTRTDIKNIDPRTGRVSYRFSADKFKENGWFPDVAGSRLLVEATVIETATGHSQTAHDTSCIFFRMPYRISFDESIGDFKPGLSQTLTVQVLEMKTDLPAPAGIHLSAQYMDNNGTLLGASALVAGSENPTVDVKQVLDIEAHTDSTGRASFNVGPIHGDVPSIDVIIKWPNSTSLHSGVQTRTLDDGSTKSYDGVSQDFAIGKHTLLRHESDNGWISLMNKSVTHLNVGDEFVSDLLIRDAVVIPQRIYYMIIARGYIINLNTLNSDGFVKFTITETMAPTIRVVLFALTHDSVGLLSDSMRINIGHDFGCGLDVQYETSQRQRDNLSTIRPNDKGKLRIQARHGDVVSLIGVDSAVYSLNNRSRLSAPRIVERVKRLDSGCGFGGGINNLDVFHNAGLMFSKDVADNTLHELDSMSIGSYCRLISNQLKQLEDVQLGYSRPMLASQTSRMRLRNSHNRKLIAPLEEEEAPHSRKKREVDAERILRRYKDPLFRSCCQLGLLEDNPQHRNCSIRAAIVERYMPDLHHCVSVYFDCCRYANGGRELSLSNVVSPRLESDEREIKSRVLTSLQQVPQYAEATIGHLDQIEMSTLIRNDFRETWLFDMVSINERDGNAVVDVQLPHSITTWSISALALNKYQPMCIMAKPLKLITFQESFLQVSMPYKVIQGEQIDLVATVFNYSPQELQVFVYMYGIEDVCSEAEPSERSERKHVRIEKHSSQSVLFPLIPLKTGKYPIKIAAIVAGNETSSDIVERQLNVVPKGRPVTDEITFSLDPMNHQRRTKRAIQTGNLVDEIDSSKGLQRSTVRLAPTRDHEFIVPQTQECIVSAIGDKMGQSVQTTMLDVENLIRLPHGCGEQVMIYLGPTLYTTRYLSSINKLSGELRWRAMRYIQNGYKRILNYRKENGAFSAFAKREPSIWLTAFIVKMLCQTERSPFVGDEIHIDPTVINSALKWMIHKQDNETGNWIEINPVYHREMLGGVLKENALTPFVALTLNECSHHALELVDESEKASSENQRDAHSNGVDKLKIATKKAEQAMVLTRHKAVKERNPYVLALTAYSLSSSQPREAVLVLNDLMLFAERSRSRHQLYWRGDYPIETAAYALQALIELAPIIGTSTSTPSSGVKSSIVPDEDMIAISNWLTSRRSFTGAFESTQDTVVALEALSKLSQFQSNLNGGSSKAQDSPSLMCNVTFSNRTRRSIEFKKDNAQVLQTFKLKSYDFDPVSGEMLDILTSGNGLGTMSIKLKYNVFQEEDDLCRFNVYSTVKEWKPAHVIRAEAQDLNQDERPGDTIEDHYFDKGMLDELNVNVVDANQQRPNAPTRKSSRRMNLRKDGVLRVRRYAATTIDSQSSNNPAPGLESWTAKVVSSVKASLPSWLMPSRTTTETPIAESVTPSSKQEKASTHHHESAPMKKTNTSRRSTQSSPVQAVLHPNVVPGDANLNSLSKQFDIGQKDNNGNATTLELNHMVDHPSHRLVLLLQVCAHHMASQDSEMSVIEIGILSGFKPNEADLKEIMQDAGSPAMKYELSADRSLVIIYMKYIPSSGPYCFQFRLVRDSLVYNIQSGYIRVYEYYSPTHTCSNFYTSTRVTDLIDTKCDDSGQVCQCAAKSLCPATKKLAELGEIYAVNATSARQRIADLVCTNRYDLVSLVRLKSVSFLEAAKSFELSVKIKSDLRGNLTKIIDAQHQQKSQFAGSVRRPQKMAAVNLVNPTLGEGDDGEVDNIMDYLTLRMDSSCLRGEQLFRHLAHPELLKQGGEEMILFARSDKLEKRYYKTTPKYSGRIASPPNSPGASFPRPKPNVIAGLNPGGGGGEMSEKLQEAQTAAAGFAAAAALMFEDAQQLQYSMVLPLDKDSILHDMTFEAKKEPRETINNLIWWLELRSRREKWTCPA